MKKILIANRGEIASRVIRTARRMDIATVAVYSDADANAVFVAEADEAVNLPGHTPAETYLRMDLILDAARLTGADAIHPGYGFLSENAEFARQCAAEGITFIGPPPEAIDSMGSKTHAKAIMREHGVPVLEDVIVEAELSSDELMDRTSHLTFPLLVKASYGGGGRGMRIVERPEEVPDAVAAARREAISAFGNGAVFLEHYLAKPRHIEVQVFADSHGNAVSLFERECSIQRRYQKIIEEAPSSAVSPELREHLGQAAVNAIKAIGYLGAGTVEFVMGQDGKFYFLEVNTRLQVEHPVTEQITGTDLVEAQIIVAEGGVLPERVLHPSINGHAIEVRLYAEDPLADFRPTPGHLSVLEFPSGEGIRVDSGVQPDSEISQYYDPMLAKIITTAATRQLAIRLMASALRRTVVGRLTTNVDLLLAIMREDDFLAGAIDTDYLKRHTPAALCSTLNTSFTTIHAVAAAIATAKRTQQHRPILAGLRAGWRNVGEVTQTARYGTRTGAGANTDTINVSYRMSARGAHALVNETQDHQVIINDVTAESADLTINGIRRVYTVTEGKDSVLVRSGLGVTTLAPHPRFSDPTKEELPGSLISPMPGSVIKIGVQAGEVVEKGRLIAVLEAMKMEHSVYAPHDGTVIELPVGMGATVQAGTVLAVIESAEKAEVA